MKGDWNWNMDNGYLKLFRCMTDWEWYSNIPTCRLFLHILLKTNWKAGRFQGKEIPVGSFVTSVGHLAEQTGLTVQQVRTALSNLKSTGEITVKSTNKYSVISVVNWAKFQVQDDSDNKQATNNQQTSNKQITTIEEIKKGRKKEISKREVKKFVPPTLDEVRAYVREKGYDVDPKTVYDYYAEANWHDSKGDPVRNWKQRVITWSSKKTGTRKANQNYEQRRIHNDDIQYLDLDDDNFENQFSKKGAN